MRETLRQRPFALVWCAGLISQSGDWVLITALPYALYALTGSPLASGLIWIAYYLPGLVFGSVAGVFVDRWDRKVTMVTVNLLQAVTLLSLLLVRSASSVWVAYLTTFVAATLAQFFVPAEHALLPRLVGEERLQEANALTSLTDNLARIIGPALGGVALGVFGLASAALLDSASFLLSGILIALLAVPRAVRMPDATIRERPAADSGVVASLWRDWIDGLRLVRRTRVLTSVFIVAGTALLADSILTALLVPFVRTVVGGDAQALGTLFAVRGVSGVLGGVVVGWIGARVPLGRLLGYSLIVLGSVFLVEVHVPYLPLILALTLANGPAIIGWLTSQQTLLQINTEDAYRGRVFGSYSTTTALMLVVGSGAASVLGDVVGVVPLLTIAAALYIFAGALALWLIRAEPEPKPESGDARSPVAVGGEEDDVGGVGREAVRGDGSVDGDAGAFDAAALPVIGQGRAHAEHKIGEQAHGAGTAAAAPAGLTDDPDVR